MADHKYLLPTGARYNAQGAIVFNNESKKQKKLELLISQLESRIIELEKRVQELENGR